MGKSSSGLSGGGIEGRQVSHVKAYKVEPTPNAVSPGAVSRLGSKVGVGTPKEQLYVGRGYSSTVAPRPQVAGAPGSSREIMRAGSQGLHTGKRGG
jgi:hypothetical protein